MKRFFIAHPTADGGVDLHPMKEWIRQHPEVLPPGVDPINNTSHTFRRALKRVGWTAQELDTEVRMIPPGDWEAIADVLGPATPDDQLDEDADDEQAFGLEYQLRDFLAQNLRAVPINGRRLQLYADAGGRNGIEYPTPVGPIDILAVDDVGGFVVFELKRARTADRAVGQLTRYMGWVKQVLSLGTDVSGVIVAKSIDDRLRYAASVIPHVTLLEYSVEFRLHPANELPIPNSTG